MKFLQYLILSALLLTCPSYVFSQAANSTISSEEWREIGGLKITGASFVEEAAILAHAGLKVGNKIRTNDPLINQAIRNLMQMRLFKNVEIFNYKTIGDVVFLEIKIEELPRVVKTELVGVKKKKWRDDLNTQLQQLFPENTILTAHQKNIANTKIKDYLREEGFPFAEVQLEEEKAPLKTNAVRLKANVDIGRRTKIAQIHFSGNATVSTKKLRKLMTETKTIKQPFSNSKYIQNSFDNDQKNVLNYYRELGFRDASIVNVKEVLNQENNLHLLLEIEEGKRYYLGNITWHGNSIYSDSLLQEVFGMEPGDVYNETRLKERLFFSPEGRDISSIYMDNGYLFVQIQPEETSIYSDTIDLKINILEGQIATISGVKITGNDRTKEAVIRRELRTKPGEIFSRSTILRSQRELINMGYFDPEKMDVKTNVNSEDGTVELEYVVEEKRNDKFELAGSWQPNPDGDGGGIVGTAGVSFNNFSIKNLLNGEQPFGDGQQIGLRAQSNGSTFQSYNLSFSEPWLGGKKPQLLSFSTRYQRYTNGVKSTADNFESLAISGATVNLGTRLRWPDDYFTSSTELSYEHIDLNGLLDIELDNGKTMNSGKFNNLYIKQTIARNSINHPFFPTRGSKVALSGQFTLPYSLLGQHNSDNWLEYHKWRFSAEKYIPIADKLALKTSLQAGYLGKYNRQMTRAPFERFRLDGDPLSGQSSNITGNEFIYMRGYTSADFEAVENGGAALFNRVTAELRYNFISRGSINGYGLLFAEAGNAWDDFSSYNPFDMKRSIGAGLRLQVPMFGIVGFDYSIGLDNDLTGRKWTNYGQFSFILGFNPE